ncbi:MAG: transglutaminase family protein [Alphaproteobacteria bacterium]|nr:transglutaminase family protein [Alphaproteobacteria bacterium]
MQFRLGCALDYIVPQPSVFIFNLAVARCPAQRLVHEQLRLAPNLTPEELVIPTTGARYTRLEVPAGHLSLRYEAQVERPPQPPRPVFCTEGMVGQIPPEALPYLFSSRYCQADLLSDLACEVAGEFPPGPPQVAAICDWVYKNLHYRSGASDASTSALDTERDRAGVCRDFAHLAIALCRAIGIPARFVTGYAWGLVMPDFHACIEAFFAGDWHLFDPSRKVGTEWMIRIGTGRDAADASFATIFGDGQPSELTEMAVFAEPG